MVEAIKILMRFYNFKNNSLKKNFLKIEIKEENLQKSIFFFLPFSLAIYSTTEYL